MMDLFKKFQKLSLKELKAWWEISTLENYIEVEYVHRGLQLKKCPAFDLQDTDVMQEWKYKKEQNRLNIEIEEIKGQLNAYQSMPGYKERETRMKEELETMAKKIMDNKQQKFLRDKVDYENERVYSWGMELSKERGRWERIRPILKQNKRGRQPKISSTPVRDMDEIQGVTFLVTTDCEIETSREVQEGGNEKGKVKKVKTVQERQEGIEQESEEEDTWKEKREKQKRGMRKLEIQKKKR
ncbi:hypothetical protein XELAEV_18026861mg [Xenopus laevis]|uniref:Uncharacterized protein n=1 Tax=Xenopus laevis TaxID=8355 RepID=A0A974HJ46_XENLA|nr:hypothetical protein XELAEV_18026861mg [Xenopus laevis]